MNGKGRPKPEVTPTSEKARRGTQAVAVRRHASPLNRKYIGRQTSQKTRLGEEPCNSWVQINSLLIQHSGWI